MLPPIIVDLIKQVVTLAATFLFLKVIGLFPNFPLDQTAFVNLVIWAVLTILGMKVLLEYAIVRVKQLFKGR